MSKLYEESAFRVLKNRDYRSFITGRAFLTFAIYIQSVVVALQVYNYARTVMSPEKAAFALGLVGAAEFVPFFIVGLFGGHVADIINRKKIVVASTALYLFCSVLLLFLSFKMDELFPLIGLAPIYAVIVITGIARSFFAPAQGAFIAQILPREELVYSATVGSVVFHVSSILGSAAGGLIYGFSERILNSHSLQSSVHGMTNIFGAVSAEYLLSNPGAKVAYIMVVLFSGISLFLFSRVAARPMPKIEHRESIFKRLAEGLKFVFKTEVLIGALALDMFAVLFGGAVAMLPAYADQILHVNKEAFGIMRAAPSVGSVLVAMFLAVRPPRKNAGKKLFVSVIGFGLCIIGFGLSKSFWLSLSLLFLSGVFDGISVVIRGTIVPLFSPENMRGRIESVNKIFIGSSNELGEFESGVAARLMGLVPSVVFGGCMTLLVVVVMVFATPKLRKLHLELPEDGEQD